MNEETEIGTSRLTKLSIRHSNENPIQLYQIDLVSTEKGKRIKNYSDRTRDFEWWVETEDICWKVPDGDYLVAQGPDLWMVNVEDNTVTWRTLKDLAQDVMARWSKLVVTDKPAEDDLKVSPDSTGITPENVPQIVEGDIIKKRPDKKRR